MFRNFDEKEEEIKRKISDRLAAFSSVSSINDEDEDDDLEIEGSVCYRETVSREMKRFGFTERMEHVRLPHRGGEKFPGSSVAAAWLVGG